MMRVVVIGLLGLLCVPAGADAQPPATSGRQTLRVFLDCPNGCFQDFLREEIGFVEYVRDPREADVHVIITSMETGAGGRERALSFIGSGRFAGVERQLKATTEAGDPEDRQRRTLATAVMIGLLNYEAADGVRGDLAVAVDRDGTAPAAVPLSDPWHNWVMSLRGSVSLQGEETNRETELSAAVSADRITDAWKITAGARFDYSREDFDLDEEEALRASRDEREFDFLIVKSLDDHWSLGGLGQIESSTFENLAGQVYAAPGVEFNVFPYSAYTRRQLRMNYSAGPYRTWYVEETLLGKRRDTMGRHEASVTLDQREPWGSLEARFEASSFLPQIDLYRFELEGELSFRIARGLSFNVDGAVTRLRDQISLPRRGATSEEVLLRLRRLQTGYEYFTQIGLTYTFGSIFNTIVNPRFGR